MERDKEQILRNLNEQISQSYQEISHLNEDLYHEIHDFKHHLSILSTLPESEQRNYTDTLRNLCTGTSSILSGDIYINAILSTKLKRIHASEITLTIEDLPLTRLSLSPVDICAILSNQLDNAINACLLIPDLKDRWIYVQISVHDDFILFLVKNSIVPGSVNSTTLKTKHSRHGYGLENIEYYAKLNHGTVNNTITLDTFTSKVVLQSFREDKNW